jgi:hypothetical protein
MALDVGSFSENHINEMSVLTVSNMEDYMRSLGAWKQDW